MGVDFLIRGYLFFRSLILRSDYISIHPSTFGKGTLGNVTMAEAAWAEPCWERGVALNAHKVV